ncbi:hypothetical protein KAF44_29135 (plasmid) [Cupriavidus necator]|nr:hypothetical protein KAF44_29135 [Cupriavidus necator]
MQQRPAMDPNHHDGTWWLVILDDSDQANAYGYHDVTNDGLPLGKVFAKADMLNNKKWTITGIVRLA